ncbi:hypothetical protein TDB9533_03017 [Thalassocella blandensis]|nr:hypothetical protein TDB9533_03017 [Thalassocella blandensis]
MLAFGRKIEQLRRSYALQQTQLATEARVQCCYISAIENGRKCPPTLSVFNQLTQVLTLSEEESLQFMARRNAIKEDKENSARDLF